jgi:hypothetical protein
MARHQSFPSRNKLLCAVLSALQYCYHYISLFIFSKYFKASSLYSSGMPIRFNDSTNNSNESNISGIDLGFTNTQVTDERPLPYS